MSKKKDEKEAKIKVKEIKKKDLKEDDVKDEKKVKKSKKGMIIAVVILSILVVALGTTVAFLLYRNSLENKTTGTGWSDKYYEFLREQKKSKNNNSAIIDGSDISFVNAKSMEDPMMIVTNNTELDGKDAISLSVFGIVDDKVKYLTGQTGPIEEAKFYYDIENKEYKYYIHSHSDNYDRYISLDTIKYDYDNYNIQKEMEKKGITDYNSEEYSQMTQDLLKRQQEDSTREELTFSGADSKVVQKTLDGKELEYNKVDEKIVDTNVKPDSFEYKKDMDIIKLRDNVINGKDNYKDLNELVNKAIEKVVKKQLEMIEKVKQDIENAKAEIKADEEKKAKEAEEALYAKGLTVGSYNLKFGKYTTSIPNGGIDGSDLYGTITLKPNGKFHITTNFEQSSFESRNIDEDGTYTIGTAINSFETQDAIHFKTNSGYKFTFFVCNNTYFNSQSSIYNYSGN